MESLESDVLFGKVAQILSEQLRVPKDAIAGETVISRQLGADSMDIMEIVLRLESEFEIEIPDVQIPAFQTPNAIVRGIQEYILSRTPPRVDS